MPAVFIEFGRLSYLIQVRGLKPASRCSKIQHEEVVPYIGTWIETNILSFMIANIPVVPYIGTWIETKSCGIKITMSQSYLIQVRGLKQIGTYNKDEGCFVVPYIGTWIETREYAKEPCRKTVVPYIGTWIETIVKLLYRLISMVVPYIGTWIETLSYNTEKRL